MCNTSQWSCRIKGFLVHVRYLHMWTEFYGAWGPARSPFLGLYTFIELNVTVSENTRQLNFKDELINVGYLI